LCPKRKEKKTKGRLSLLRSRQGIRQSGKREKREEEDPHPILVHPPGGKCKRRRKEGHPLLWKLLPREKRIIALTGWGMQEGETLKMGQQK